MCAQKPCLRQQAFVNAQEIVWTNFHWYHMSYCYKFVAFVSLALVMYKYSQITYNMMYQKYKITSKCVFT